MKNESQNILETNQSSLSIPFIYLTQELFDEMLNQANIHDRETGGVVIGSRWIDDSSNQIMILIQYVSDEGQHINGSNVHFNGDMEYFSQKVEEWQETANAEFLGIWHSHPPGFNHLSNGDLTSAKRVFQINPNLTLFIAPLVIYTKTKNREINFYFLTSTQEQFIQIPFDSNVKIISNEDAKRLKKEPLNETESKVEVLKNLNDQWTNELKELKQWEILENPPFTIEYKLRKYNDMNCFNIHLESYEIDRNALDFQFTFDLIFPPEYPQNPPLLYSECSTNLDLESLLTALFSSWDSSSSLTDIIAEFTKNLKNLVSRCE